MTTIGTPSNIEVLLHFHSCETLEHPRGDSDAVKECILQLVGAGAIEPTLSKNPLTAKMFKTTPLGKAWVKALCNTPPPRMAFIDQQGKVIQ